VVATRVRGAAVGGPLPSAAMGFPEGLGIVDLLVELPRGGPGMGMKEASRLMRDAGSREFSHHPAQYLFKDAPERMADAADPAHVVALMDAHGIAVAQIDVNPRRPEHALELFERFPGRFFGTIGVDPNQGMEAVRDLRRAAALHPNVRSCALAPCLYSPQVPIDDKRMYPIYATCIELGLPVNVLVGVPGPRVPFDCQRPERLDEVCWFFPELTVVMRHGGEPWVDLCVKLLLKWPNLHYSTSAFAPKHYPREILEFANTRGTDKVVFAGYYPGLSWERVLGELRALPLRDHVWAPFLRDNAWRLFSLDTLV
jgi:predicted TIM-barrel fold metal-dependent hydrolase